MKLVKTNYNKTEIRSQETNKMSLKKAIAGVCLGALLLTGGCGQKQSNTQQIKDTAQAQETAGVETEASSENDDPSQAEASRDIFAMDTYMSVTAFGENADAAVDTAQAEIERLDAMLATGNGDSEIARLNVSGTAELSVDAGYLVERALELYTETDGAFDIAIYPVMEAWGFPSQNYQVPSEDALQERLALVDASKVSYDADSRKVSFGEAGMEIDLGGIAKGYTSARIMDIFRSYGITSGLVNLGGNVQVLGTKTDGSKWRVAVQSPDDERDYLGVLSVSDKAVITSGGYERYFEQDGITYHHIIDPKTGYPAENGLKSVTIVSADGTLADGLSTSLFIMGEEKAAEFWRMHSDEFDAILLTDDGTIYVTEGIADDFSTELSAEVIRR